VRNIRRLPIKPDAEGFLLRMEAEKTDGTPIYAEGYLQRPGPFGTRAVVLTRGSLTPPTSDLIEANFAMLMETLRTVAGESA
jgi:hypothetical protein